MIEQGIAAGQQERIRFRFVQLERNFQRFHPVDPESPSLDDALFAQACQHTECAGAGDLELRQPLIAIKILGDIVDVDNIEAIGFQTLQAVFDRAQRGIGAVVVDQLVLAAEFEQTAFPRRW